MTTTYQMLIIGWKTTVQINDIGHHNPYNNSFSEGHPNPNNPNIGYNNPYNNSNQNPKGRSGRWF